MSSQTSEQRRHFRTQLKSIRTRLLLTGVIAGCLPVSAQAQDANNGQLQDIVVTAQRRAENLQNVPIAITAVSSKQLQSAGVVSTQSLPALVSGLNVGQLAGAFQPRVRGVGTSFFGPGVENPVALYVDDVYYASQFAAPTDLYEVDQIAVLKGPQGTLFGRNATGGVIQMTTRQPKDEFGGEFASELDQYLTSRNYAYATGGGGGVKANLFARYTTQGEGWGKNLVDGSDVHKIDHDWLIRGKLFWDVGDQTTIKFSGDYSERKDNLGPNYRQKEPAGYTGLLPGLGAPISAGGPVLESSNPWDVTLNVPNHNSFKGGGGSVVLEQHMGFADLTSITAYRTLKYAFSMDADGSSANLYNVFQHFKSDQFSQEVRLASKSDSPLQWQIGGYYYHAKDHAVTDLPFYDASADAIGPNAYLANFLFIGQFFGIPTTEEDGHYDFTLKTESLAAFGEVTAHLMENTRLTAGLRYTHDRRVFSGAYQDIVDGAAFGPPQLANDRKLKEGKLTWRLSLAHDFSDTAMAYASYNRGYKSGGFNVVGGAGSPPYKSETVDTYEIGAKLELADRRIRINPAIFYSDYKNVQVNVVDLVTTIAANAPGAELYGFDLDTEWRATNALSFNFGMEWMHSKFTSFPGLPSFAPLPGGGIVPIAISGAGNALPMAPDFTFNLGATYKTQLAGADISFSVLDSYNDGFYFEADNVARQKSYHLVSASVNWTSPDEHLTIGLFGRNLANEAVAATASGAFPVGYLADFTNPPRTYGVSVKYKFGAN